jgi:hypothetical protein
MKVREIELGDVFIASRIIRKIDVKSMISEIGIRDVTGLEESEIKKVTDAKAMDVIMYLMARMDDVQNDVMELIGSWCGISVEEAAKLKISELKGFVDQFVEVNGQDTINSFFKRATSLGQKKA